MSVFSTGKLKKIKILTRENSKKSDSIFKSSNRGSSSGVASIGKVSTGADGTSKTPAINLVNFNKFSEKLSFKKGAKIKIRTRSEEERNSTGDKKMVILQL